MDELAPSGDKIEPLTLSWWNSKDLMVTITEDGGVMVNDREAFAALFDALPEVPNGGIKSINVVPESAARPGLVRNEEGRFLEFVGRDVPTVTGQMMALNVEPIYRMDNRTIIGYRVYDDALFPSRSELNQ